RCIVSAEHWFEPVASHLGSAYLRYSFTRGTRQEVEFLVAELGLGPGDRVLDVGCGPGRHALELARRGIDVHGIDISEVFIDLASRSAEELPAGSGRCTFERLDARSLGNAAESSGGFDAAICLCQGAFGLMLDGADDRAVIAGIAARLRPGGVLALSAFNAYFAVKYQEGAAFDADRGISHELTEIRSDENEVRTVDLWTGCYTPRELRLLLGSEGFTVESLHSVEPGKYRPEPPSVETPEYLVLARKTR
ncbi:MAG: methyltransferase domain-containing protein, partial [Actinomycetota bacterium]